MNGDQFEDTTPLRMKGDNEDVFRELDNGRKGYSCMKRPEFYCSLRLDTLREDCGIIRKQASTDGGVLWEVVCVNVVQDLKLKKTLSRSYFMFLDFIPVLPNESINFAFVWRVSGIIPEFTKSIFSSDKLSDVYRKAEVWSVDYSSGRGSRNSIRYIAGKILNG
ncbi:hypothetical protein TNCV_618691 [Trichonephila clavipes]|nr:hypothetical protein TNCV_618691 [Trichonephila clavipes]